jgi:hypothetical protein
MKKLLSVGALIFALALFAQERQDDPPPEGTYKSCDNYARQDGPQHRCACGKAMHTDCEKHEPDVSMDRRCKTYCSKQNCRCLSACTT